MAILILGIDLVWDKVLGFWVRFLGQDSRIHDFGKLGKQLIGEYGKNKLKVTCKYR